MPIFQTYEYRRQANISGQVSERTAIAGTLGFQAQANITRGPQVIMNVLVVMMIVMMMMVMVMMMMMMKMKMIKIITDVTQSIFK